ncbi:hypothetical protein KUA24_21 [Vibrio phage HNL01]|nr:hypothetical protein KUA24_21 [Vibrio phage HNL01]
MYKSLSMEVEVIAGTTFKDSVYSAQELAKELNIAYTKFKFNGISVSVGQKFNLSIANFDEILKEGFKSKYLVLN